MNHKEIESNYSSFQEMEKEMNARGQFFTEIEELTPKQREEHVKIIMRSVHEGDNNPVGNINVIEGNFYSISKAFLKMFSKDKALQAAAIAAIEFLNQD